MKVQALGAALACVNLLLVRGMDLRNCAENNTTVTGRRVIFGKSVNPLDFPFLVKLKIGPYFCAGSIVTDQWILTAGHCLYERDCSAVRITPAVWKNEEGVPALECHVHAGFSDYGHLYDIAVIGADRGSNDRRWDKIPLPRPGTHFTPGTSAVTVGWGKTEDERYPGQLLGAELRVENWDVCNRAFIENKDECKIHSTDCIPEGIPKNVLCLVGEGPSPAGTCYGDSGGPIVIKGVLAGIVSFGITNEQGECIVGSPTMQTSVVDYLPWIYSIIAPEVDTSGMEVRPEN